jgi:hypothetical protein
VPSLRVIADEQSATEASMQIIQPGSKTRNCAVATGKNYVRKCLFLLWVLFVPYGTSAQIGPMHGTIVVIDHSSDELVVVADSMGSHGESAFAKPDYTQCKILAFDNQMVFAAVNALAYQSRKFDLAPNWDARDIVRRIVAAEPKPHNTAIALQTIATKWATAMADELRGEYRWHPSEIIKIAKGSKGLLSGGFFFAKPNEGEYQFWTAIVTFNKAMSEPIATTVVPIFSGCWVCGQKDTVCAAGQPAVVTEFCTASTQRARGVDGYLTYRNDLLESGWDSHSLLANRLADLTEAYDTSGTVGGPIDIAKEWRHSLAG